MMDNVNHPSHYGGEIECKDAIREAIKDYTGWSAKCAGDIIKYIWRAKRKNGIEDLRKALKYCEFLVEEEERNENKKNVEA